MSDVVKNFRIFLAHPSNFDAELPQFKAATEAALKPVLPNATVVAGAEDYAKNFVRDGGWEGWCRAVGSGVDFVGTQLVPRYNAYIVGPSTRIGKATADILRYALRATLPKPVYFFDGVGRFEQVQFINTVDDFDYKQGWEVVCQS